MEKTGSATRGGGGGGTIIKAARKGGEWRMRQVTIVYVLNKLSDYHNTYRLGHVKET